MTTVIITIIIKLVLLPAIALLIYKPIPSIPFLTLIKYKFLYYFIQVFVYKPFLVLLLSILFNFLLRLILCPSLIFADGEPPASVSPTYTISSYKVMKPFVWAGSLFLSEPNNQKAVPIHDTISNYKILSPFTWGGEFVLNPPARMPVKLLPITPYLPTVPSTGAQEATHLAEGLQVTTQQVITNQSLSICSTNLTNLGALLFENNKAYVVSYDFTRSPKLNVKNITNNDITLLCANIQGDLPFDTFYKLNSEGRYYSGELTKKLLSLPYQDTFGRDEMYKRYQIMAALHTLQTAQTQHFNFEDHILELRICYRSYLYDMLKTSEKFKVRV